MFKGLLIYWINPNNYQINTQDKEMNEAYDYFVQKLRKKNPELSTEFEDDVDFIEEAKRHPSGGNRFSPAIGPFFWYTQDATMDIELINRNMKTIYMPNIDTNVNPNIRGLCIGLNDGDDTTNLANPDYYKQHLAEYLPSDFNYEKYVGTYSMIEY